MNQIKKLVLSGSRFDWYVDSINGNDTNNGKSSLTSLKTLEGLVAKSASAGNRVGLNASRWRSAKVVSGANGIALSYPPSSPLSEMAIFRQDSSSGGALDSYWMCQHIGDQLYACFELRWALLKIHTLQSASIRTPVTLTDPSVGAVEANGTWIDYANALSHGGGSRRSDTTGATWTWTTAAGVTKVGAQIFCLTLSPLIKVTIDGDNTRANLLPTAQELVTAGTYPNTILVANGGSLNPTDRVFDAYSTTTADQSPMFAIDLTAGVHTVILTNTGYNRGGGARMSISGTLHATASTTNTTGNWMGFVRWITQTSSVFEYAVTLVPTGASTQDFTGNGHDNDTETAFTITVDGATDTLAAFDYVPASSLSIRRVSYLTHPQIGGGTTAIADVILDYTLIPGAGLEVNYTITHLSGGTAYTSYSAMCPVGPYFSGSTLGAASDVVLTANNSSQNVPSESSMAWLWEPSGEYVVTFQSLNVLTATNSWAKSGTVDLWIEDRNANPAFDKVYLTRIASGQNAAYLLNDVWASRSVIGVSRISGGATSTMAR